MPCAGLCRPLWGVLRCGNIGIAAGHKNAVTGLQMAFTAVLLFGLCSTLMDKGAKCRLQASGGPASGGKLLEDIGTWAKGNPPQESPGRAMILC